MGFQKSVGMYPALGTPGLEVHPGQAVYTAYQYVSDGTVEAGAFAFAKVEEDDGTAVKMNVASKTGKAGAKVLGLVERNLIGNIINPLTEYSNTYPAGVGLPIAMRGQFYITAPAAATEGQAILCDPATGAVTFGAAGAANDTGWIVKLPQGVTEVSEGDLIIAENFGLSVAATPASGGNTDPGNSSKVGEAEVGKAKVAK